ncbi:hypothetical protein Tco_0514007 [Tanacetum coccineum]
MRFPDVPSTSIKLMLFPFSLEELHQLDTSYNALNANDQDSLNSAAGGKFLDKMPRECLRYYRNSATVKAVEQNCVTCGGTHSYKNCPATDGNVYQDNIQEYVSQAAAANFNQGNTNPRPPMVANQIRPPGFPPIQNNQNRFNPNQGNNFKQNRGTNFNQNRGSNFNQGQVYQPPTIQTPVYQAPTQQMQGVSKTDFENYVKANDAVLRNMQNQGQGLQNQMTNLTEMLSKFITSNSASSSNSGNSSKSPDLRGAIILGRRPFLCTVKALIDLYEEKLTLRVGSDDLVFYAEKTEKSKNKQFAHAISVIDFLKDEPFSGNSDEPVLLNTLLSDKVECFAPEDDIDEIDGFFCMKFLLNFEEFAGEIITLPSRVAREHEEYLSRMTLVCEISISRSQENVHANPSSIIESLPVSLIPVEDSDLVQEEIDIFLVPDDLIPPGVENDDSEDEDNELPNLDHQDNPSSPRPPPEPPDVCFNIEPDTAMNDEDFNQGEIVLSIK